MQRIRCYHRSGPASTSTRSRHALQSPPMHRHSLLRRLLLRRRRVLLLPPAPTYTRLRCPRRARPTRLSRGTQRLRRPRQRTRRIHHRTPHTRTDSPCRLGRLPLTPWAAAASPASPASPPPVLRPPSAAAPPRLKLLLLRSQHLLPSLSPPTRAAHSCRASPCAPRSSAASTVRVAGGAERVQGRARSWAPTAPWSSAR
jgi:hypothetical protein